MTPSYVWPEMHLGTIAGTRIFITRSEEDCVADPRGEAAEAVMCTAAIWPHSEWVTNRAICAVMDAAYPGTKTTVEGRRKKAVLPAYGGHFEREAEEALGVSPEQTTAALVTLRRVQVGDDR